MNDFVELDRVAADVLTYSKDGLTSNELYQWTITAVNTVGTGPESPIFDRIAVYTLGSPAIPTSSFADQTSITIDWIAPGDGGTPLTNFVVSWDQGSAVGAYVELETLDPTILTLTKTGLTAGEVYQFKVGAVNANESGPLSDYIEVIAGTVPEQPTAPTSSFADKTSATLNWTPPNDGGSALTNYILQWN